MKRMHVSRQTMTRQAESFGAPLPVREITPTQIQLRLSSRLRKIIGRAGRVSLAEAARITEIHPRTLKAYVDGTACPNLARYGRLLRVFGPEVGIEMALMLGWEPRAISQRAPQTDDLVALRDAVLQALRVIDLLQADSPTETPPPRRQT